MSSLCRGVESDEYTTSERFGGVASPASLGTGVPRAVGVGVGTADGILDGAADGTTEGAGVGMGIDSSPSCSGEISTYWILWSKSTKGWLISAEIAALLVVTVVVEANVVPELEDVWGDV